jgi:hypothetical protein
MSPFSDSVTRRLDLSDPREIEAYERAFHAAFERATHNRLVRWLWEWDDAGRRLRTRIPYEDQAIWVLPPSPGSVTTGLGVNVRMRGLQASAFGFRLPDDAGPGAGERRFCEILTLFIVRPESLRRQFAVWREVFGNLRGLGFTHAVATTAPKVLPLYRFLGARVLAEACVEGERRIFLEFDLSRVSRGNGRRG